MAWAFAAAGQFDKALLAALVKASEERLCDFDSQELTNSAWALATASQSDEPLCAALADAFEECMCDLNPQELANTAWDFAKGYQLKEPLFAASATSCCKGSPTRRGLLQQQVSSMSIALRAAGARQRGVGFRESKSVL